MRIIKPQQLIFLNGRYQIGQQSYLGVSVVAGVWLSAPQHFANEADIWAGWAAAPLSHRVMDLAEPKPFAEYLLAGHAGIGTPVSTLNVRVKVGELQRQWRAQGESTQTAMQVEPFLRMPLDHPYCYGGANLAENPAGRGFQDGLSPRLMLTGADGVPQVNSPLAAPCPLPQHFQVRKALLDRVAAEMGGEHYLKTLFPGYPPALDAQYFQLAAPAQRYHQAEWPDEVPFMLEGCGGNADIIQGAFPQVRGRLFYSRKEAADRLIALEMARKTLWLLPDSNLGLMVFTAAIPLDYLLQEAIATLVIGLDGIDAPRSDDHFRAVHDRRLAKENSPFEFLHDPDLMPVGMAMNVIHRRQHNPNSLSYQAGPRFDYQDYYAGIRLQLQQHQQNKTEESQPALEKIQWEMFPQVNQKHLHQLLAAVDSQRVEGEIFTCQSVEQLNPANMKFQQCQFVDCSFSQMVWENCQFDYCQFENCTFSAVTWKNVVVNKCRLSDAQVKQGRYENTQFVQTHFAGIVAPALFSHGVKWQKCQFAKVNLHGAVFEESEWDNCTFADSDLAQITQLHGMISGTLFNHCQLQQARFEEVTIDKASILNSECRRLSFLRCKIDSSNVQQDCCLAEVKFEQCIVRQAGFRGVHIEDAEFVRCVVQEADFDHAQLARARFILCDMPGMRLKDANMQHTAWDRCSLQQAVLYHADIRHANFRSCNLVSANLSMTIRHAQAPFSDCLLNEVTWYPLYQGHSKEINHA